MINRRGFLALATAGTAATALAACGTGSSSDESSESKSSGGGAGSGFPVEVKHAFGTTKIEKAPTKVVVVGWGDADVVAALGVAPVAAPEVTWGANANKSTDWLDAQLKKIGGKAPARFSDKDGTPVDKIATYQPDLILGTNSGLTKEQYDKLSKIAPTVAYPKVAWGTSWQESTTMIATALGKKAEGEKLMAETKKKISDAVVKYPELKGKTASWVYFTPTNLNTVGVYTPIDNRPRTLAEFGLPDGDGIAKQTKSSKSFFVDLSAEKAAQIDSDIVVFDELQGAEPSKIKSNALLGKIPAIKNDTFVSIKEQKPSAAMSGPSVLSIPVALETFLPQLAAAANKVK